MSDPTAAPIAVLRKARRAGVRLRLDTTVAPPAPVIVGATKRFLTHALRADLTQHRTAIALRLLWEQGQIEHYGVRPCATCGAVDFGPTGATVSLPGTEGNREGQGAMDVYSCQTCHQTHQNARQSQNASGGIPEIGGTKI